MVENSFTQKLQRVITSYLFARCNKEAPRIPLGSRSRMRSKENISSTPERGLPSGVFRSLGALTKKVRLGSLICLLARLLVRVFVARWVASDPPWRPTLADRRAGCSRDAFPQI